MALRRGVAKGQARGRGNRDPAARSVFTVAIDGRNPVSKHANRTGNVWLVALAGLLGLAATLLVAWTMMPQARAQDPERISADGVAVPLAIPAGTSLVGWFGAQTTSMALIDGNDAITTIWWLDAATSIWDVDSRSLPPALRMSIPIVRGTGFVVVATAATTLNVPVGTPQLVGEDARGSVVTLQVVETLEVLLAGNPTTGFQWEVAGGLNGVVAALGEPGFVVDFVESDEPLVGVGGHFLFRFVALSPGTTTLDLVYRRPFDPPEMEPERAFTVDVVVANGA